MSKIFPDIRKPFSASSIADLGEKMLYRIPGCSDEEVRRTLQTAYSDFCRLSLCYRNTQTIDMEAGETMYPIAAYTPDCFVDSVTDVRIDGRALTVGRDCFLTPGTAVILTIDSRFVPDKPTETQLAARPELSNFKMPKLYVSTIELPKLNAERAPRWFFDKYGEAVVSGALVKLFGMANKPWTDGVQAQHELVRWENYLTDARIRGVSDDRSICGSGSVNAVDTSGLL